MFCSKCGAEAIEGAVFCEKCGARLIQNGAEVQSSVPISTQESAKMLVASATTTLKPAPNTVKDRTVKITQEAGTHEETLSISGSDTDIYAILKDNIVMCPSIKSAKQVKKGIRLCGKIYIHSVIFAKGQQAGQVELKSVLPFPLSIMYGLPVGLFCCIIGIMLADLIRYGSICIEYYHSMMFALGCLVVGVILFAHSFAGCKEKVAVADYVRKIVELKSINLFAEKKAAMSKIRIVGAVALTLSGIIILLLSLPNLVNSLKYHDELLYNGIPATRFLEMTREDVESEYGEPWFTGQHIITGDDYYDYSSSIGSIGDVVYSEETGKVIYIQFYGDNCSCNGKKLDKPLGWVLDILSARYKGGYPILGVYGSRHSGFYYEGEAVYFGETLSREEILDQMEFEGGRYGYYNFVSLDANSEEYYDLDLSSNVRRKQDYKIDIIYRVWMKGVQNIDYVCLYTDEWIETLNASYENILLNNVYTNEEDSEISRYEGSWSGRDYDRIFMEINYVDANGGYFDISISWASSALEWTQWELWGTYMEEEGVIQYYGNQIEHEGSYETGEMEEEVVSEVEEGILWFGDDGLLYWDDYTEPSGESYILEKTTY